MKLAFVMPSIGRKPGQSKYIRTWQMEPLSIGCLSALTPSAVEKSFFDDRMEDIDYESYVDVCAITSETYTARRAYEIANTFREKNKNKNIKIIMGGFHPTLVPGESSQYADSIVIGEAEDIWKDVIEDAASGILKNIYKSNSKKKYFSIQPDRSIFSRRKYLNLSLIETGRGCLFHCDFCTITSFYSHTYRQRDIDEVIYEIKQTRNKRFFFVDDNVVVDREHAKKLFTALIPLNITWFSQGSIDMAKDDELLYLMKKSGCAGILIGFESTDPATLLAMNKRVNVIHERDESVKKIQKAGLRIYSTFIFGYDRDNNDSFEEAFEFCKKHKLFLGAFNHVVPFPGTTLYNRLLQENRMLDKTWWLNHDYSFGRVSFIPENFTPEDLALKCYQYREKFYSMPSILQRMTNPVNIQNPFAYLFINLLSRFDIKKRQGLQMGTGGTI